MGLLFGNPYEFAALAGRSVPPNYWQQQNLPAGQMGGGVLGGLGGGMGGGGGMQGGQLAQFLQILRPFIMQALQARGPGGGPQPNATSALGGGAPLMGAQPQPQTYAPGRSPQDIEAAARYMAANPGQFQGLDLGGMDQNTLYQRAHFMQSNPLLFQNLGGQISQVGSPLRAAPSAPGQAGLAGGFAQRPMQMATPPAGFQPMPGLLGGLGGSNTGVQSPNMGMPGWDNYLTPGQQNQMRMA